MCALLVVVALKSTRILSVNILPIVFNLSVCV
jgi:hypothetical protein